MLKDLISYIGSCVDCKSKDITLEFVDSNVKGYAAKFSVKCIACDWEYSFSSSPEFRNTRSVHRLNLCYLVEIPEEQNLKKLT